MHFASFEWHFINIREAGKKGHVIKAVDSRRVLRQVTRIPDEKSEPRNHRFRSRWLAVSFVFPFIWIIVLTFALNVREIN